MKNLLKMLVLFLSVAATALADTSAPSTNKMAQAAHFNAELAVAYLKTNDVVAARIKIEKALKQNVDDPEVQSAAGLVYERLQEPAEADKHYSQALRLEPKDPNMQNNYAVFACRNGKWDKGQQLFEQAARNPAYVTPEVAYTNAGVCARSQKNLVRAEEWFRKALAVRETYPDALLQMADLSLARGNGLAARAFLQRYFATSTATAESLLLGIQIEGALGDKTTEERYRSQLQHEFAESDQAQAMRNAESGR
jgi:type IV pilus assembly protein PilF